MAGSMREVRGEGDGFEVSAPFTATDHPRAGGDLSHHSPRFLPEVPAYAGTIGWVGVTLDEL